MADIFSYLILHSPKQANTSNEGYTYKVNGLQKLYDIL